MKFTNMLTQTQCRSILIAESPFKRLKITNIGDWSIYRLTEKREVGMKKMGNDNVRHIMRGKYDENHVAMDTILIVCIPMILVAEVSLFLWE